MTYRKEHFRIKFIILTERKISLIRYRRISFSDLQQLQIFLTKHRHNPKFYRTLTLKKQNSTIDIIKIACVLTLKSAVHLTKSAGCPE